MPKSKKRHIPKKKNKKKSPKPYQVITQEFVKIKNPIPQDIPFDVRIETLSGIGQKAIAEFEEEYQKLVGYFKEYDPLYLCSFASRYFATTQEGIDEEAIKGSMEFYPFYLEILQCVSLQFERTLSAAPLDGNIYDFKSTIQNMCRNQSLTHLALVDKIQSQENIDILLLRTEMMRQTTAVRNWAYPYQMKDIAHALAESIEPAFSNSRGFKSKDLLDILFSLAALTENKLNNHIKKTREYLKAKNYKDVLNKYEANFPKVEKTNDREKDEFWELTGKNLKNLKGALMAHSDLFLGDVYTHNLTEIYNHMSGKTAKEEIAVILSLLSFQFGDLVNINKDHIFLDNPIHAKPFIKIDENNFFSAIPHIFSHLGVDLLERIISNDTKLKNEYSLKKAKYLEHRVEDLFRSSFPDAQILSASLWKCPDTGKEYENDLIVLVEDFAIIIECKSGTVSPPAKRGATDRLIKTLQELVVAPSEQAIRFETYLRQNKRLHKLKTKSGSLNIIDSEKIKYFIPLGITLSNLGAIGCNLKKLIEAKVAELSIDKLAPSISLSDLKLIFEILTLKAEKIHYLARRREFEAHLNFQGDEMDLFGFYLRNGFNIGETEYNVGMHIDFTLLSKELDPYFIGKGKGKIIKKPVLQKSKYWNDLLVKVESESSNWLLASYILLHLSKEDQIEFEKKLKLLAQNIIKGKCEKRYNYMMNICGPERRKYAIVGFPYINTDRETRNAMINDIVSKEGEKLTVSSKIFR